MKRLALLLIVGCFLLTGQALAQDLPQKYENETIGLSMDLPEDWVVNDKASTIIFITNSQDAMSANALGEGHLFITVFFKSPEDRAEDIDTTDGVTALEVAQYYEEEGAAFYGPDAITQPSAELDDFELDAAAMAATTSMFDQTMIIIVPDEETIIEMQARTLPGAMADYEEQLFAMASTLRYEKVIPEPTPSPTAIPLTTFESEDGVLGLQHPAEWFTAELEDGQLVASTFPLEDGEELPLVPEVDNWIGTVTLIPIANLDIDLAERMVVIANDIFEVMYPGCYANTAYENVVIPNYPEETLVGHCDDPEFAVVFTLVFPDDETVILIETFINEANFPRFEPKGYQVGRAVTYQGELLYTAE